MDGYCRAAVVVNFPRYHQNLIRFNFTQSRIGVGSMRLSSALSALGRSIGCIAVFYWAVVGVASAEGNPCGSLYNPDGFGPYDYRIVDKFKLLTVEKAHFTPRVEQLIGGQSSSDPAGDIDYTLRKIPNHHRALLALSNYSFKVRSTQPRDTNWPVECYFERALRFMNDDIIARMLYANYLTRMRRLDDAVAQLNICTGLAGENAISHYNIGLIYVQAKRNDLALARAHRALALGLAWPELKDKLVQAGAWTDPPANPPSASSVSTVERNPTISNPVTDLTAPAASTAASAP